MFKRFFGRKKEISLVGYVDTLGVNASKDGGLDIEINLGDEIRAEKIFQAVELLKQKRVEHINGVLNKKGFKEYLEKAFSDNLKYVALNNSYIFSKKGLSIQDNGDLLIEMTNFVSVVKTFIDRNVNVDRVFIDGVKINTYINSEDRDYIYSVAKEILSKYAKSLGFKEFEGDLKSLEQNKNKEYFFAVLVPKEIVDLNLK